MSNKEVKEEEKFIAKGRDGKQKTILYKPFKSKIEGLEDAVFESGAVKHAAQFTKMLEEIAKYIQKKYNSDVAKMIKDVERQKFDFRVSRVPQTVMNLDGTMTQEKIDEMGNYVWKKDYELTHN